MKRREIDIFGVLVGIVIGCILGFFLSTRINIEMPIDNEDEVLALVGNVYLLQIEKTTNPGNAQNILVDINSKGLYAVAVLYGNNYYIYGGIANTESELESLKLEFSSKGYNPIIKREYILDKPNIVIDEENKYKFYSECTDNLIRSLKGEKLEISAETKANPANLELFSAMLTIDSIQNEKLLSEIRLSIYKMITEDLN